MVELDVLVCILFLVLGLSTAGVCQVLWLRTEFSRKFTQRVDFGLTFRGRPLFGENKTARGFMVMVPASGFGFWFWSQVFLGVGLGGLWEMSALGFIVFGCLAGFGFMAGELPNSFLKRQLDIAPGEAPADPWLRRICLLLDRTDSLLGALFVMSFFVVMPWTVWLGCLIVGPGIHAVFSFALYRLGVKKRAG